MTLLEHHAISMRIFTAQWQDLPRNFDYLAKKDLEIYTKDEREEAQKAIMEFSNDLAILS